MSSNLVLEQYESGRPIADGTLGNLSATQDAALRDLWRRLLAEFPKPANNSSHEDTTETPPTPLQPPLSADSVSSAKEEGSSVSLSSHRRRFHQPSPSSPAPPTPTSAEKSSRSSSWFSFGGGNGTPTAAKAEPTAYRQLVGDVAVENSLPPARYSSAAMARAAPTVRDAFWDTVLSDHPDVLLLRFLRARKWNAGDALAMLLACLRWRQTEDIEWLIWTGESRLNLGLMRSGVGAMRGTDRIGQPVLHIPVRLSDPKAQPFEQMVEYTVYLMEVARCVLHPPVEKVCLLIDTTDMSLANMDWAFFKTFLHYLEHYYPECLGLVLIYNASWVFNSLWKLIRPLLDPVVASKVHFAGTQKDLLRFIAPENLPIEMGGSDTFTYTYVMPAEGENAAMFEEKAADAAAAKHRDACDDFEAATRVWVNSTTAAASDSLETRSVAADNVVAKSRELDTYRRARSQYHRTGVI
ncbi:phosphatidylinositol transfer protein csr1 [Coemansia aciculifera]|uniref:Phosphatidylinositol transfer protein csr1 n=1 Tax=Coemansia aciculifera TaxID=417176 RepID=A0ACC1M063_9FUNG|nr:phosphatidylinositol transfer protein csr1 [Coemansia aciculifera]KAJ2911092.1 phosphatidylinositol transfer protein csr1 [Coemansia aciculifera]